MFGFSNFIVCSNGEIAKKIAYNQNLKCKCVTFDGDVLQPGTLTGGHMKMGDLLISSYRQLRGVDEKLKEEERKYDEDRKVDFEYQKKVEEYKLMKKDLEAKRLRR